MSEKDSTPGDNSGENTVTKHPKEILRASDVLNWDYLVEISDNPENRKENLHTAIMGFAYDFTSTADEEKRDTLLRDMLTTENVTPEYTEELIKILSDYLRCDHTRLRDFAKENGVRLSLRKTFLARLFD